MVKSQNDENQKETVFNILGNLADNVKESKNKEQGLGQMDSGEADDIDTIDSYLVHLY